MLLEITSIVIITGHGTDNIFLHTTLPDGCWPYTDTATATINVARGSAVDYVEKNFPGVGYKLTSSI